MRKRNSPGGRLGSEAMMTIETPVAGEFLRCTTGIELVLLRCGCQLSQPPGFEMRLDVFGRAPMSRQVGELRLELKSQPRMAGSDEVVVHVVGLPRGVLWTDVALGAGGGANQWIR